MGEQPAAVAEHTVLLVEDDSMVRSWVRLALEESEFRVIGEAESAAEAVMLLERRVPEILLLDYRLPDSSGSELLQDLRRLGYEIPAVLMTANAQPGFNEVARDSGAQGTVLKTGKVDDLLAALRGSVDGRPVFDVRHPKRPPGTRALSPREREVLRLVADGATNREIARRLAVGDETIKTLLARIFSKLGVGRRAEAVSMAHQLGLL